MSEHHDLPPGLSEDELDGAVAIVGMAGRFPGAPDVDALWHNAVRGIESITEFSPHEREPVPGLDEGDQATHVCAAGLLDDFDKFDAAYFGMTPREAELIDPQHRLFLECAVHALEDAGCDPERFGGAIGVFGGCGPNGYLLSLLERPERLAGVGLHGLLIASEKDFLTTRVSHRLNLRGPSVLVQTACSTSLVAVHMACQSVLSGESDLALAGGVGLGVPQRSGSVWMEGGIFSRDGRCRPFDADADGTTRGSGVAMVALKRLDRALADRDHVHAVIRGTAINNDGAGKINYTAPSIDGQAAVIAEAHAVAGIEPASIGYVETHGTGTAIGDPIEVAALRAAFGTTDAQHQCALGALKANIGHLDAAAGVAGLIKAACAVRDGVIPPVAHYQQPNPRIDFSGGPFYVPKQQRTWDGPVRRAGVSSFGIGGTNAHVVLERAEVPIEVSVEVERPATASTFASEKGVPRIFVVSGHDEASTDEASQRLADALESADAPSPRDAAWTLQTGRRTLAVRRAVVARTRAEAAVRLRTSKIQRATPNARVAFVIPGQGAQRPGVGATLYHHRTVFSATFRRCAAVAREHGLDLPRLAFESKGGALVATDRVQPVMFALGLSLAHQWQSWGIDPVAMLGHSLGEWVAAAIAGVFDEADAMRLVIARGKLVAEMDGGAMLSVRAGAEQIAPLLPEKAEIAAYNGPSLTTLSGPVCAIAEAEARLSRAGFHVTRLQTSHGFHSASMQCAAARLAERVAKVTRHAPRRPFVSNVTGTFITDAQATDPSYWARHLRAPVRFAEGLVELTRGQPPVLLELGPGRTAIGLAAQSELPGVIGIATLARGATDECVDIHEAAAALWRAGVDIDLARMAPDPRARRVRLPGTAFRRTRCWIDAATTESAPKTTAEPTPSPATIREVLAEAWTSVLGTSTVEPDDDFFALNGDSLSATQLVSRLRAANLGELAVRDVFEAPTFGELVARVERRAAQPSADAMPTIAARAPDATPVLSFAQQRLWFLDQLDPGSPAYNVPFAVRAEGDLDAELLTQAVTEVIARHESLRTTIRSERGRPVAVIADEPCLAIEHVSLEGLDATARDEATQATIDRCSVAPFDLAHGPLVRMTLIRRSPRETIVVLVVHHVSFDVWSVAVFVRELMLLYQALVSGMPVPSAAGSLQYPDFAAAQREWMTGEVLERQLGFWTEQLGGPLPHVEVPPDRPMVPPKWQGAHASLDAGAGLTAAVTELARRSSVSPFMVLLTAYKVLLSARTGQTDIVVGTDVANRNRVEVEPMIGFFVNQLVLRTPLDEVETFGGALDRVREHALASFEHQDLPFDRLVEALRPDRHKADAPLFSAKFVMRNVRIAALELPGLVLTPLEVQLRMSPFPFLLAVAEGDDGYSLRVEYQTRHYTAAAVERFLADYRSLLERIVDEPTITLESLIAGLRSQPVASPSKSLRQRLMSARRREAVSTPG